jgi:hypothetical protein
MHPVPRQHRRHSTQNPGRLSPRDYPDGRRSVRHLSGNCDSTETSTLMLLFPTVRTLNMYRLLLVVSLAIFIPAWAIYSQAPASVQSTSPPVSVAKALASFNGPLILVFSPGAWGEYCTQREIFSAHAPELHNQHLGVIWLSSHDAGAVECRFNNNVDDMSLPSVSTQNDGPLLVYKHFNVPLESFTVILLGKDGRIKLTSRNPVSFDRLRLRIGSTKLTVSPPQR